MHPVTDILIRTYPGDFCWLWHCLDQIRRHARGFRRVHIVVPEGDSGPLRHLTEEIIHECPRYHDDYIGQQITKMLADTFTDADLIMHMDSDVMLTRETSPEDFLEDGRVVLFHEPYEKTGSPWQPVVAEILGWTPEHEFMRRHPFMYPSWLYGETRRLIEQIHGTPFDEYVISRPHRSFSEFNVLGAVAWKYFHDRFVWSLPEQGQVHARQFWSWGGIDAARAELEETLK
jgi:hypothetical protein